MTYILNISLYKYRMIDMAVKSVKKNDKEKVTVIEAANLVTLQFNIKGISPYVQHKFSKKCRDGMLQAQIEGSRSKSKTKKTARDIKQDYVEAMHLTKEKKHGIPAPSFRNAMISACRLAGFQMTRAKLAIFVVPDDFDADDGTPLVYIKGKPHLHESSVRLESGVASIAIRPMWREWTAKPCIKYDADLFSETDIANLLSRAGLQVGIGEGRPDSKKSYGLGWGTFELV